MNAVKATGTVVGTRCAECGEAIQEGDLIVDQFIYDIDGTLDYIELLHERCGLWLHEREACFTFDMTMR